jgi:hypothetical protein
MTVVKHGVSTSTADRLLKEAGVVYLDFYNATEPGTLLGATQGGNTFEINRTLRDIRPDGAKGPVKGFRRLEEVVATLKVNLLEITAENLRMALAGATYGSGTTTITTENCGDGTGSQYDFPLDHSPVKVGSEIVYLEGVAQVRGTDYTMDYSGGIIQFVAAPGSGSSYTVTCTYDYISATATMGGGDLFPYTTLGAPVYLTSVALLVELTGYANPAIFTLSNCLVTSPLNIDAKPKSEAIPSITFQAHYSLSDLAAEPWSITYPAS